METLKEKRLKVLEDTVKYFNINTRCLLLDGGNCQYSPIEGKSEGCAVGRMIEDKALCKKLDDGIISRTGNIVRGVGTDEVFELLPANLRELGQQFLKELQNIHDYGMFWDEKGLNKSGLEQYDIMKHNIENDKY